MSIFKINYHAAIIVLRQLLSQQKPWDIGVPDRKRNLPFSDADISFKYLNSKPHCELICYDKMHWTFSAEPELLTILNASIIQLTIKRESTRRKVLMKYAIKPEFTLPRKFKQWSSSTGDTIRFKSGSKISSLRRNCLIL